MRRGLPAACLVALTACGGGNSTPSPSPSTPAQTYSLSGTISGLNGGGLVLAVNGSSVAVPNGTTTESLASGLASGSTYAVSVGAQPGGQTCSVAGGTGSISSANVANVVVTCSDQAYALGGTISGYTTSSLVLANGTETTEALSPGATSFTLPPVAYTSSYSVTVQNQPVGEACAVSNGTGTMGTSAITSVAVTCTDQPFTLGGAIGGLTTSGLVLANGSDTLSVSANATTFTMPTPEDFGSSYALIVQSQPSGLTCSFNNGPTSGTMPPSNITDLLLLCSPQSYTLGGTVSGLAWGTLGLEVGADSVTVTANGSFQLPASIAYGSSYTMVVAVQPLGLTCSIGNGSGTMGPTNVTNIAVTCSVDTYTIGGTLTGLGANTGLVLLDNGGNATSISANASRFTMNTGLVYGNSYAVTVQTNPLGLVCAVSNGTGTVPAGDVISIAISCAPPTDTVLYSFASGTSDGQQPVSSLIQASDGNFYGLTGFGGMNTCGGLSKGCGTIFKYNSSAGTESVLYSFAGGTGDAQWPSGSLLQASDGNFYGLTVWGGANDYGALFKYSPTANTETMLWSFGGISGNGISDAQQSYGSLIQGRDGKLYGLAYFGGSHGNGGALFDYDPTTGTEAVLWSFGGTGDGESPAGNLIQASDGNFYGMTSGGGSYGQGTLFEYSSTTGTETVLWSFGGTSGNGISDGAYPGGSLIQASDGNFYGLTPHGGSNGEGTLFEYNPTTGTETVLWSFGSTSANGLPDGLAPEGSLIQGSDGNFYGLTSSGGISTYDVATGVIWGNSGTLFEYSPTASGLKLGVLWTFGAPGDGQNPNGSLIQGSDGSLYGLTPGGGANGNGTLFKIN
ncbi:MAG TPA: choice-of-anchor tandem repeat GloVer-containing protein [Steroidobacteraceae bacterium]